MLKIVCNNIQKSIFFCFKLFIFKNFSLLAAKCDGNFACVDLFQQNPEKKQTFKFIFDSSNLSSSHDHQITCIQWYPIDSGMFFTSGMDQKFKVWDTNTLQVSFNSY